MLGQICQFLGVDSNNFPLNEHILIIDKSKDGGFLIHFFLNLCLKQNRPVCFVGLAQSLNHYKTVAQKLGTNLLDENNDFTFIEGLKLLNDFIANNGDSKNPFIHFLNGKSSSLTSLIHEALQKSSSPQPPVIIIDDLSVLTSVGVTQKQILCFMKQLQGTNRPSSSKLSATGTSLISSVCTGEEDSETWGQLSCISTLIAEISNLKSGYCKEVHGQIKIQWHDLLYSPRQNLTKFTQYKLLDKGIDLFASGTSSAVL